MARSPSLDVKTEKRGLGEEEAMVLCELPDRHPVQGAHHTCAIKYLVKE